MQNKSRTLEQVLNSNKINELTQHYTEQSTEYITV